MQVRAIRDCQLKLDDIERSRILYRGALLWMKDLSEKIDPERYSSLEKFKRVRSRTDLVDVHTRR